MDICQLSPHSVAWLLAFMIGLSIVVRGRVQVPSLNAGINSGGLIWIGPYRRETETSGNIVCSPMELSPLCSVDKWRMQSRAISPLAGGSDGSQGCQMLSLFNRENNAETVFDSGQEIYITVGVRKPVC
uniref:Uncharacterized protein n=1 Tax=Magallana gigas TaxID=29159 RepID=A0A8W8LB17_MAGGI|nr:uncharacterized protein LOC105339013 [Crassostrea gigas]